MSSEVLNSPIIHTTQVHLQVISSQSRTWPDDVRKYMLPKPLNILLSRIFFFIFLSCEFMFLWSISYCIVSYFYHPYSWDSFGWMARKEILQRHRVFFSLQVVGHLRCAFSWPDGTSINTSFMSYLLNVLFIGQNPVNAYDFEIT